jgi:pilus assembly protein CpaB
VVLALLAVFMVKIYTDQQQKAIEQKYLNTVKTLQENQTSVLVAKQDIPKGTFISPDFLETKVVPNEFVQPQAVTSMSRIDGMVAIAPIAKDEQVTMSKLMFPKQAGDLAEITPVGKRAITLLVDNISSLMGMLKAGDYVDIIAVLPVPVSSAEGKTVTQATVIPLFQNVLVLAVGQEIGGPAAKEERRYRKEEKAQQDSNPPITVALKPQEASLVAFAQEQGKIRLVLRSPSDSQVEPVQLANWDTLFQYLAPKRERPPASAQKTEKDTSSGPSIEIYRGMNKEKLPLR